MAGSWQTVRVFISSTFRDMQAERDHLVKVVFPALRERLESYRVHLIDIDLRWGVTKEQAENDQALDLCLQQIDECRPFFIGLLGERYGWVPTSFPLDALAHYGWIQHHTGKSVTELEMLYGVLTNPQMQDNAFFYLRDPTVLADIPEALQQDIYRETDSERMRLLAELKVQIRDSGFPVMEPYPAQWDPTLEDRVNKVQGRVSGLHEFGKAVEKQLWTGVQARLALPEHPPTETLGERDPLAEEQDYHERYMESRLRVYVGRETIEEQLVSYATGESTVPCLVTGPSGSGKSAALAHFARTLQRTSPDTLVIPHFIGASPGSTSLRQMLRRFCLILKTQCGFDDEVPHDPNELVTQFRTWVGQVPETEKLVFVIDALNQLDETGNAHSLYWLPREIPIQVKMVVSCIVDPEKKERVLEAFEHVPCERMHLEPLNAKEQRAIVRKVPSLSAKTLDETQIEMLLANPATANPLFLLVALEELRGFGSFEELSNRVAQFPQEGDTVTALFTQVINRLTEEFDEEVVQKSLALLSCSRQGLSQRELLELIEGDSVEDSTSDLFPILRQLRPYLQHRGNLLDFFHRNLFKAVKEKCLPGEKATQSTNKNLADYFHRKADPANDGSWSGKSPRGLEVLPYYLVLGHQWDQLNATLLDFRFLQAKLQTLGIHPLLDDYELARKEMGEGGSYGTNEARTLVREALSLSAHVLAQDPTQLSSQLHGRLFAQSVLAIQSMLAQAKHWVGASWLRPLLVSLVSPGGSLIRTLDGHTQAVEAVAVTPDGQRVVTGSADRTVKVWDLSRGTEECTLQHTSAVAVVALTPDGQRVVTGSGSWDGTVKVWDLRQGVEVMTLRGHRRNVEAVAVTPDGQRVVTGSADRTVKVWDLSRGTVESTLQGTAFFRVVAVTPDGQRVVMRAREEAHWPKPIDRLATTSDGQRAVMEPSWDPVKVWDLGRGVEMMTLRGDTEGVEAVAVTPDGQRLVTGSKEGTVKVWDLTQGVEVMTLKGHSYGITAMAVTPDGQRVVTGSWDGTVKVWDLTRGEMMTLRGHTKAVAAVALTPDGLRAVTGSKDCTVKVWDLSRGTVESTLQHTSAVVVVALTPNGQRVVTGSWDMDIEVKVWDLAKGGGTEGRTLRAPISRFSQAEPLATLATTPDGQWAVTGSLLGTVTVWDLGQGVEMMTLRGHTKAVAAVALTPDGLWAVTGSRDRTVKVWDLSRGTVESTLQHTSALSAVAVTPDGQRAVTVSCNQPNLWDGWPTSDGPRTVTGPILGTVTVWDLGRGVEVMTLKGNTSALSAVAVTPDGQRAVTGSSRGIVTVWDLGRGVEMMTLRGHTKAVSAVALTPDGLRAVSGSDDHTVKVWDLTQWLVIASFSGESGIISCAVTLDGSTIIIGEQSGRVHFLRLEDV